MQIFVIILREEMLRSLESPAFFLMFNWLQHCYKCIQVIIIIIIIIIYWDKFSIMFPVYI